MLSIETKSTLATFRRCFPLARPILAGGPPRKLMIADNDSVHRSGGRYLFHLLASALAATR